MPDRPSDDEARALHDGIARVRRRAGESLTACASPAQTIAFIRNLQRGVDALLDDARRRRTDIACRAGCASCCHLPVEVSPAEAALIAGELRRWPAAELAALRLRLQRHAAGPPGQACPFLSSAGALCSIYELRPATCRRAHSLEREACTTGAAEIPQDRAVTLGAEALIAGTRAAYRDRGLPADPQLLASALLPFLEAGDD